MKPKETWQAYVEQKKAVLGLTNKDIADAIGTSEAMVKMALTSDRYPTLSAKICKYFRIKKRKA